MNLATYLQVATLAATCIGAVGGVSVNERVWRKTKKKKERLVYLLVAIY